MEKTIGAVEARRSLGRILQDVAAHGDRVVVERNGQPVAAVVPIDVYNRWKHLRTDFFARIQQASERADLTPEEADQFAADAVAAVRAISCCQRRERLGRVDESDHRRSRTVRWTPLHPGDAYPCDRRPRPPCRRPTAEQVLVELPDLEPEDVRAALQFAARWLDHPILVA